MEHPGQVANSLTRANRVEASVVKGIGAM